MAKTRFYFLDRDPIRSGSNAGVFEHNYTRSAPTGGGGRHMLFRPTTGGGIAGVGKNHKLTFYTS